MHFAHPHALWLLAAVPAAVALYAYAARRRAEAVGLFLGRASAEEAARLDAAARGRRVRGALVAAALALIVVALAGPRAGRVTREARQERLDLLVVLDVSNSMRAEDVAPSRLARAKAELARLAQTRRSDRLGLVVFAGDAFLQCPLTADHAAFRLFLDAAEPDLMPVQGSDLGRALDVAHEALRADAGAEGEGETRPGAVLVVSDGEDHEGGAEDAARALAADDVPILAASVGTAEGGRVPLVREGRLVGYRRDEAGEPVVTRLDERALAAIADGPVVRMAPGTDAATELAARLDRLDRTTVAAERVDAAAERYQWPLALALLLLVAERLVALRRTREAPAEAATPAAA